MFADVAQLVEQGFRKAQVGGSIPLIGSKFREAEFGTEATLRNPTNGRILVAEVPKYLTV